MTREQLSELAWVFGTMAAGPVVALLFFWADRVTARLGGAPVVGPIFAWWNEDRTDRDWYPETYNLVVWGSLIGVALPSFVSCGCYLWVTRSHDAPFATILKALIGVVVATLLHTLLVTLAMAPFAGP